MREKESERIRKEEAKVNANTKVIDHIMSTLQGQTVAATTELKEAVA